LYSKEWDIICYNDSVDWRMTTVLPIVAGILVFGVKLLDDSKLATSKSILFAVRTILVGIGFSGCYIVFRNWFDTMRRCAILSAIERKLGLDEMGIIPAARQFAPPGGLKGFLRALQRSMRFPLILFYSVLGGTGVVLGTPSVTKGLVVSAITVTLLILAYCFWVTYSSYKEEF